MPVPPLALDHITVFARTLAEGAAHVRAQLGVEMGPGGAHPRMGTHNLLMSLGPDLFLEVIAIDPDAPAPDRPRWFGLDGFNAMPRLGTWVLRARAMDAAAAALPECGPPIEMTRGALNWLITVPEDGGMALDGAFPSLIEWPPGPHPAASMPECGCRLTGLQILHPEARHLAARLGAGFGPVPVAFVEAEERAMRAEFDTPAGPRRLG